MPTASSLSLKRHELRVVKEKGMPVTAGVYPIADFRKASQSATMYPHGQVEAVKVRIEAGADIMIWRGRGLAKIDGLHPVKGWNKLLTRNG